MRGQDPDEASAARTTEATETATEPGVSRVDGGAFAQTVLGWLTIESTPGALFVDFAGNASGPLRARSTVRLDDASLAHAVALRQPAALVFENGDPRLPIVLGLLQPSLQAPSPLQALLTSEPPRPALATAAPSPAPSAAIAPPLAATVDGRRVVIAAEQEITLTCGEASLTLRRDGKILLRGAYVETYARGLNRIKGAQVKIN